MLICYYILCVSTLLSEIYAHMLLHTAERLEMAGREELIGTAYTSSVRPHALVA